MILVEGPDGAGKTTLAKLLAEELDFDYLRPPPSFLDSTEGAASGLYEWWTNVAQLATIGGHKKTVFDRAFPISEVIYTSVMGREPLCGSGGISYLIHQLKPNVDFLIFCLPTDETLMQIYKDKSRPRLKGMTKRKFEQSVWLYRVHYTYYSAIFGPNKVLMDSWFNRGGTLNIVKERYRAAVR